MALLLQRCPLWSNRSQYRCSSREQDKRPISMLGENILWTAESPSSEVSSSFLKFKLIYDKVKSTIFTVLSHLRFALTPFRESSQG